jgi:hypothetical protein
MSAMPMKVLNEIVSWAGTLPAWQSDAFALEQALAGETAGLGVAMCVYS